MNTQLGHDQQVVAPQPLSRITRDPQVMEGRACIRGMRVSVGMIVGQIGAGRAIENVLEDFPYLELEDVPETLQYSEWVVIGGSVNMPSRITTLRSYPSQRTATCELSVIHHFEPTILISSASSSNARRRTIYGSSLNTAGSIVNSSHGEIPSFSALKEPANVRNKG